MKTIKVNENYKIEFDGNQFTPYWFKAGGESMRVAGRDFVTKDEWKSSGKYFQRLESACKWIMDDIMSKDGEVSMTEFIEEYRKVWEDIKRIVGLS